MPPLDTFVGRDAALGDLERALDSTSRGRGVFVVVSGGAGIGKTRLVREATADRPTYWGRLSPDDSLGTLWPWRQILRAAARDGVAVDIDAVARITTDARERIDGVVDCLRTIAAARPGVVAVVDDLQWADPESLNVLKATVLELDDLPLAVVVTAREGFDLAGPRADLDLRLEGLVPDAVAALVADITGDRPDGDTVSVAVDRTGGNPFFIIELARALRAGDGGIDPAAWADTLPASVRSLVSQRIAALPARTRDVVQALAVAGMESDPSFLAALVDADAAEVTSALQPATDAAIVRTGLGTSVSFTHALMRDAVLHETAQHTRRELHRRAADALAATADDAPAGPIARHLAAAGSDDAVVWARRAGDRAQARARHDEAVGWYRLALTLADDLEVKVALGESLSRIGDVDVARSLFTDAATQAREHGADVLFARAALGIGTLAGGFEIRLLDAPQLALLEEAVDRVDTADGPLRACLLARLSVSLTFHGQHDRRVTLADEAVALARDSGDDRALVAALAAWSDAHAGPRHCQARTDIGRELVAAAVRTGDPELQLLAHRYRIVAAMEVGDVITATNEIQAFATIADHLQLPSFRWYARVVEGMLALLHGDVAEAERCAHLAIEDGKRADSKNAGMLAKGALLAAVLREKGDGRGAVATTIEGNAGDSQEADRGFTFVYPLFLVGYGFEVPEVPQILSRLPSDMPWIEEDALFLYVWSYFGNGAAYVDDRAWADSAWERLSPYEDRFVLDGTASVCVNPVALTLARLSEVRESPAAAERYYDLALEVLAGMDAPLLTDRILAERRDGPPKLHPSRPPSAPPATDANRFVRDGDTWLVAFDGDAARLRDSKGMRDLAVLLARPGEEVHALDLVAATESTTGTRAGRTSQGDLGPAVDSEARRAYEERIRELTELVEEAEASNDLGRAAKLDDERAILLQELAGALGLSGRARPQGTDAERARKAVSMRIRDAIARIDRELPALGNHLRHAVRTGTFCSYSPEHPIDWS